MGLIDFDEYKRHNLPKDEQEIVDTLLSKGCYSLTHILVKLFGDDARHIVQVSQVVDGKWVKSLEIKDKDRED
jgi:hypothetical protein